MHSHVKEKNVIEELAKTNLEGALSIRFDICTCQICRKDMLNDILKNLGLLVDKFKDIPKEQFSHAAEIQCRTKLAHAVASAIEKTGNNPSHKLNEDLEGSFKTLIQMIQQDRGLDLRHYHRDILKRRLSLRIHSNNLSSYSQYIGFLEKNPREYEKLFATLCINVSEFFRDPPVWITLKYMMESIYRRKNNEGDRSIRIWSAGCANGEEPYSVAMVVMEALKDLLKSFRVEIMATDIDDACLKAAEKAQYKKTSLVNLDQHHMKVYFSAEGEAFKVRPEVRKLVSFYYLDLTGDRLVEDTDLIICRNVFIYFNKRLQKKILEKFHASLRSPGHLILGKTESLAYGGEDLFEEIDASARIYRKK